MTQQLGNSVSNPDVEALLHRRPHRSSLGIDVSHQGCGVCVVGPDGWGEACRVGAGCMGCGRFFGILALVRFARLPQSLTGAAVQPMRMHADPCIGSQLPMRSRKGLGEAGALRGCGTLQPACLQRELLLPSALWIVPDNHTAQAPGLSGGVRASGRPGGRAGGRPGSLRAGRLGSVNLRHGSTLPPRRASPACATERSI